MSFFAAVDWGYQHFGAIVVIAEDDQGDVFLIEEYAAQFEEIDYWVEIAKGIKGRYGNINFYCDTARPEYIKRFRVERLRAIHADKSVLSGIEEVARLIKQNKFYVLYTECPRFRQEIYKYVWHATTGEPVKQFDDVLDALCYAIYTHYKRNILRGKNR